jgi:hypothetical protein
MQARGGESIGKALANLGQIAGKAIGEYQEKKQINQFVKQTSEDLFERVKNSPELFRLLGSPENPKAVEVGFTRVGGGDPVEGIKIFKQAQMKQEQEAMQQRRVSEAVSRYVGGDVEAAAEIPENMLNAITNAQRLAFEQRTGPEQPKLSFPEQQVQAEMEAFIAENGRPPRPDEMARIYQDVAKRTVAPVVSSPPPGYELRYDDQGRPLDMRPIPGGPAAQDISNKEASKAGVTKTLMGMANNLNRLYKMGVAVSSTQGAGQNVLNRIRATDFGQGIEGALGTEAQAVRQAFKNAIPVYINDMRQATEMSAKGMDSEKELEFYLRSAGDEKSDVVTSMAALYTAGERFGTGGLEVLQGLNPELRRAVLIRAGQLLEEADSEQYRGNLSGSKSGKTPATPSGGIRKWNPQTGRLE